MKCSSCKFYQKSKMYGNYCNCHGAKPCMAKRRQSKSEHRNKAAKSRKEKWI